MAHMQTIDEIRRENLARLVSELGGNKRLAGLVGVSESQMNQWVNGAKESSTGKPRGMRLASCHRIEDATGKSRGWLDQRLDASVAAAAAAPAPTLTQALETLGIALAADMPDDVRQDAADLLAKLAQRHGAERHQAELSQLLQALPGKRTGTGTGRRWL